MLTTFFMNLSFKLLWFNMTHPYMSAIFYTILLIV